MSAIEKLRREREILVQTLRNLHRDFTAFETDERIRRAPHVALIEQTLAKVTQPSIRVWTATISGHNFPLTTTAHGSLQNARQVIIELLRDERDAVQDENDLSELSNDELTRLWQRLRGGDCIIEQHRVELPPITGTPMRQADKGNATESKKRFGRLRFDVR
jgi:hypothetical protein